MIRGRSTARRTPTTVDGLACALWTKKVRQADPVYLRLIGLWEASERPRHGGVLDKLGVLLGTEKVSEYAMPQRSTAFARLAMGISQQATQAFTEGQTEQVKRLPARLGRLDPPNPINVDLRAVRRMLKAMDAPPPNPRRHPENPYAAEENQ